MRKLGRLFADDYEREVALSPALAVVATPVAVVTILGFNVSVIVGLTVLGFEFSALLLWILANTIRDAGKKLEKRLFGGVFPTTQSLRLKDSSGFKLEARRALLIKCTGITLLTKQQELRDASEADERITYAINIAKEKMRDAKKFKVLRRELKSYGFWRNMVAIKWWGFGLALSSLVISGVFVFNSGYVSYLPILAFTVSFLGCMSWLLIVRDSRVTDAAERYSEQFFNSLSLVDFKPRKKVR